MIILMLMITVTIINEKKVIMIIKYDNMMILVILITLRKIIMIFIKLNKAMVYKGWHNVVYLFNSRHIS